jgi:MFS family permease
MAVVACAFVGSFPILVTASATIGAGVAGIAPVAYALIPLLFYNNKRQLANSIYVAGGLLGAGPAIALCGNLITLAEWGQPFLPELFQAMSIWRLTFILLALPAPLFVILLLCLRLPKNSPRPPVPVNAPLSPTGPQGEVGIGTFIRQNLRTCATFFLAVSIVVIGVMAVVTWWPVAAMREFGATPTEVGNMQGLAFSVSAVIAMLGTSFALRFLRPRYGVVAPLIIVIISFLGVGASMLLSLFAGDAATLFTIFGFFSVFATSGSMAFPTALQELGPSYLRGRLTSIYTMFSFAGVAIGPLLVGTLSDMSGGKGGGLIEATALVGTVAAAIGFILLLLCFNTYAATHAAARSYEALAVGGLE